MRVLDYYYAGSCFEDTRCGPRRRTGRQAWWRWWWGPWTLWPCPGCTSSTTSSWSTRSQQSSGSDYRAGLLPGSCSLHPQLSPLWRTPTLVKPTDTELPKGPRGHLPLTSSSGITDPRTMVAPPRFWHFWPVVPKMGGLHRQKQLPAVAGAGIGTSGDAVGRSVGELVSFWACELVSLWACQLVSLSACELVAKLWRLPA